MIEYVIKMNGETIEGHPITIDNFKQANKITDRISIPLIQEKGYAPFHKNVKPVVGSRQKVEDNGYFKDTDNFVKHNYQIVDKTAEELLAIIEILKAEKKAQVKAIYEKVSTADVTDGNNNTWNGGFDSAMKLDAAKRLAETIASPTVTFFDVDNQAHMLTIAEATDVVLAVANVFQTALAQKQNLYDEINDAVTIAELDAAEWTGEIPEGI